MSGIQNNILTTDIIKDVCNTTVAESALQLITHKNITNLNVV
jgi:hypothetical protein